MGDMTIRPEDAPKVNHLVTEAEVLAHTNGKAAASQAGETDLRITDSTLRDGSQAMAHQ